MRIVGVLAIAIACLAPAAVAQARPGIVGGAPAPAGSWPSTAFLYASSGDAHYGCTGSVVAADWIVTAAHCAYGESGRLADSVTAVLGAENYTDQASRQLIGVDRVVVDPDYVPGRDLNDIAMLHLGTPTTAPAIRLATKDEQAAGAYISYADVPNAAGWGATDESSAVLTTALQQAYLEIRRSAACASAIAGFDADTQICAGTQGKAGACHGDSGGPLVVFDRTTREPVLWGVTSYGAQAANGLAACSTALPVVYTWVPAFVAFIASTIATSPPSAPVPVPLSAPSGPVAAPPIARASAACVGARAKLASAKKAEKAALDRLRRLRRAHASRARIKRASTRYHVLHARRLRDATAAGRLCG